MELTTVMFGTEDGKLLIGPALLREGQLWLVAKWRESQDAEHWWPAIAIRLPMEAIQHTPASQDCEYLLSGSIPKQALAGQTSELLGLRFEVLEAPPWPVDAPTRH